MILLLTAAARSKLKEQLPQWQLLSELDVNPALAIDLLLAR